MATAPPPVRTLSSMDLLWAVRRDLDLEQIPASDGLAWDRWCEKYDVYPLDGPRRGWWTRLNTYVRDASHVVMFCGVPVDVITWSDYEGRRHG